MDNLKYSRRNFMKSAGLLSVAGMVGTRDAAAMPSPPPPPPPTPTPPPTIEHPFVNGTRTIVQYPQKRPLILLTGRAVQLETPLTMLDPANINNPITPNDTFFVRYHNANIPLTIDAATHKINVTGNVNTPLSLTVADLKNPAQFQSVSIVAVNACTGNSRASAIHASPVDNGRMAHRATRPGPVSL